VTVVGEGPTLTTARLRALPLTVWNAGFIAEELATTVGVAANPAPWLGVGGLFGDPAADEADRPAVLRRELRRRAGAGREVLTWVIRGGDGTAVGLLGADTHRGRAAVAVSIGSGYRRRGYATEALRALAGWLELRAAVVETRVRVGDKPSERLALATFFVPTEVLVGDWWRVWFRPPAG
jgi:RimJ/RimL family protein N-acetyltransferase